jgi:hypothetical protein
MRKELFFIYLLTIGLVSCNTNQKKNDSLKDLDSSSIADSFVESETHLEDSINDFNLLNDSDSIRKFAELILEGKIKPTDNQETYECLNQLITVETDSEKEFYFEVFQKISKHSDGALSEMICGIIKTFFELNPDLCIEKYNEFDSTEKKDFIDYIAFEFYASGTEFETDICNYIERTEKRIKIKSSENSSILEEIRNQLIDRANEMNN